MKNHIRIVPYLLSFMLLWSAHTLAADAAPAKDDTKKSENTESDKLDVQKLEQKYWAAKDDDFTVVQNRAFAKDKRWFFNFAYGAPINDPFSTGSILGLNVGYYFSERWGAELNYRKGSFRDNESTVSFIDFSGVRPDTNRFVDAKMFNVTWVPLYAKMSWLDRKIIYFDMGLQAGLGTTAYEITRETGNISQSGMSYSLNLMQHFFFSEHWALRVDFTNTWTSENRKRYNNPDRDLPSRTINDTSLLFGLTYWK